MTAGDPHGFPIAWVRPFNVARDSGRGWRHGGSQHLDIMLLLKTGHTSHEGGFGGKSAEEIQERKKEFVDYMYSIYYKPFPANYHDNFHFSRKAKEAKASLLVLISNC